MNELSPDERIGQLFMVAAYSDTGSRSAKNMEDVTKLILEQKIGGLIFFKGHPFAQAKLTNYYQNISKVPLLIGMDAEWGLAMRLDSVPRFPYQMMLGAMNNSAGPALVDSMGAEIARECKELGVQIDFAPVIDINDNPDNPVIGMRSFGEDKYHVSQFGMSYMKGLQNNRVLACGKHFPGHGDTKTDSHLTLPVIDYGMKRMDTLELYPFKTLINAGLSSIMVAHLYIPAIDSTVNQASTLSPKIVTALLKDSLGFKGLVFTDALNMKGVSKFYAPGKVDVKALLAGNDVLLFPEDVEKAIKEIKNAIKKKELTQEEIDAHCRKILMAKAWTGLNHRQPVNLIKMAERLNIYNAELVNRMLAANAITLLKNKNNILPINGFENKRIAALVIGDTVEDIFQSRLSDYAPVTHVNISKNATDSIFKVLYQKLDSFDLIILGLTHTGIHPQDTFLLSRSERTFMDTLLFHKKVILDLFSNPYIIPYITGAEKAEVILESYQDMPFIQDYSAQMLMGGLGTKGRLPVTVDNEYKRRAAVFTNSMRLSHITPEEEGINRQSLAKIDSIANNGLRQKAYPGCVILAAKNGNIFYEKSFGTRSYSDTDKVKLTDVYDLASVTKIAATTAAVMKLVDEKKLSLDTSLYSFFPLKNNRKNKKLIKARMNQLILKDVLTHQAGLKPDIFFWKEAIGKKAINTDSSVAYPVRVAKAMYLKRGYKDTMITEILNSPLGKHEYKYSDLGMILLGEVIKKITGLSLDEYVQKEFYTPMGLPKTGFLPLTQLKGTKIIPTGFDSAFRKETLQGEVNDPSAAMFGGVAGNAGLFSDAEDLAAIMQMFIQYGSYGGNRYLDSETVKLFTSAPFLQQGNRRGLGFDKPEPDTSKVSPACRSASSESFGHSGFTGTFAWADPEYKLVYVFLSNRVADGGKQNKLVELNIRTNIQEVIYNSVIRK
jgi:beta-glucosidase-like glycosyl hydrolase/CubicO group peptidase (beta-lactamase class C family)